MRGILKEFQNSMTHLRNNVKLGFLVLPFVNQRPFQEPVTIPVNEEPRPVFAPDELNNLTQATLTEYANSLRRKYLNDMAIAYERYATRMLVSYRNDQNETDPATSTERLVAHHFEQQFPDLFEEDELIFLKQFRHLRNSIVHYNGTYNVNNPLDYTFGTQMYESEDDIGENISIQFENCHWIWEELSTIVSAVHERYADEYE